MKFCYKLQAELEITARQQTMSGLIGELTGEPFILPVMLTMLFSCFRCYQQCSESLCTVEL